MVYRTAPFSMILNDPWFSRSRHSLTPNISEMVKDTAIVTMEGEYETVPNFQMVTHNSHNFIHLWKRQHNYTQKNESEHLTNQQQ